MAINPDFLVQSAQRSDYRETLLLPQSILHHNVKAFGFGATTPNVATLLAGSYA
jgi:hypothetical protein